jgi:hypothetical protein
LRLSVAHCNILSVVHCSRMSVVHCSRLSVVHYSRLSVVHCSRLSVVHCNRLSIVHCSKLSAVHCSTLSAVHCSRLSAVHCSRLSVVHCSRLSLVYCSRLSVVHFSRLSVVHYSRLSVVHRSIFAPHPLWFCLSSWTSWPFKMRPISCPETSVRHHPSTPRDIPEEHKSHCFFGCHLIYITICVVFVYVQCRSNYLQHLVKQWFVCVFRRGVGAWVCRTEGKKGVGSHWGCLGLEDGGEKHDEDNCTLKNLVFCGLLSDY